MLQLITKLINMFSYSITTHFIYSNKYYNSSRNPHSIYQSALNEALQGYCLIEYAYFFILNFK